MSTVPSIPDRLETALLDAAHGPLPSIAPTDGERARARVAAAREAERLADEQYPAAALLVERVEADAMYAWALEVIDQIAAERDALVNRNWVLERDNAALRRCNLTLTREIGHVYAQLYEARRR